MSSQSMLNDLHEFMLSPDFRPGPDGYAPVSLIARAYGRSITSVNINLRRGIGAGLFVARTLPSRSTNGHPVIEYAAVPRNSPGIRPQA